MLQHVLIMVTEVLIMSVTKIQNWNHCHYMEQLKLSPKNTLENNPTALGKYYIWAFPRLRLDLLVNIL